MRKFVFSALCLVFLLSISAFIIGCNQENNEPSTTHTHTYAETVIAPTCTTDGYTSHICECGDEFNDNVVAALGHSMGEWQTVKEPSETENGLKTRYCTRNGCGYSESENIPQLPHTHKFTEKTATEKYLASAASCTAKATYFYSCKCGETGTDTFEYGDYGDHTYSKEWTKDENTHWHASICIHNAKSNEEPHNFVNNVCSECLYDRTIKVSGIVLNKSALTLNIGDDVKLIATVLPDNATNNNVLWKSSSPRIATVENGKVTAIAKGTAIITATAENVSATCSVEVIEDFLFTPIGGNYSLTSYTGNKNVVEVPAMYNGKPVTVIDESAFYDCSHIKEIILPSTIKEISKKAFGYCTSLEKIKITSCTRLMNNAFLGCTAITEIYFPDGLISIGTNPFAECSSLTKITIESGTVSSDSFAGNTYVKELVLGSGVTEVAQNAFSGCSSLEYLTLPKVDKNNTFDDYYFGKTPCTSLKKLTITNQVISVYDDVFKGLSCLLDIKQRFPIKTVTLGGNNSVYLDEFDFNGYQLKITYTDGFTETFPFELSYLQSDLSDLQTSGKKILSLNYCGVDGIFELTLKLHIFSDAYMEDMIFVADGSPKNLTVKGAPKGTSVIYKNNGQTEAGEYTVTATLAKEYYEAKTLTATLKIRQEKYNILYFFGNEIVTNNNPKEYYYGKILTLNTPTNKAGEFVAWYTDENCSNPFAGITETTYGDISLYAKWSAYYTVSDNCITGLTETGKNLSVIDIPFKINGVTITAIGESAFEDCSKITGVTIPDSITSIGKDTFYGCSSLNIVNYTGTIDQWAEIEFNHSPLWYAKNLYINNELVTEVNLTTATKISNYAFSSCRSLTSITIPDSVTSIGGDAFSGCSSLTSVTIGDSVTSIYSYAFYDCSNLSTVNYTGTIDQWIRIKFNNETSNPLCHAGKLYINNDLVTEINLTTATKISDYAFYNCSSLMSVIFGNRIKSIGYSAFYNCPIESAIIPTSVIAYIPNGSLKTVTITGGNEIYYRAFYNYENLTSITIPDSVTYIGNEAFDGCPHLEKIEVNENNMNFASYGGILYNKAKTAILFVPKGIKIAIIPDSVYSIDSNAFSYCDRLTSVTIGSSIRTIGSKAFYYCRSLTSITIPDSVTSIGNQAFENCYKLVEVINNSSLNITKKSTKLGYVAYYALNVKKGGTSDIVNKNGFLFYTYDNVNYLLGYAGTDTELVLPDDYIGESYRIYEYSFYGCGNLTNVTINDSITYIGESAFRYCYNLTSITIGISFSNICSDAFANCRSLTTVTIHDNVTYINSDYFKECNNLTKVNYTGTIDQWVEIEFASISSNPLYYAKNLYINDELVTELNLTTATKISDYAFAWCSSLTSVTIGDNVTFIGRGAFHYCSSLTSVAIPDSVSFIDGNAFYGCDLLIVKENGICYVDKWVVDTVNTSITVAEIKADTKGIVNYAFHGCSSLTSITIPNSITSIGVGAFANCSSLTSITIPDSITSIGGNAFANCSSLTSITIPDSITSIGVYAFADCSNLKTINYKGSKEQWNSISKVYNWNYKTGNYTINYNYEE